MISFRTHVVTLVAVFLALGIGVVLGGGPLSEIGRADEDAAALRSEAAQAREEAEFGDRFAADIAPTLMGSRLKDRDVAVITLPGVDAATTQALTERITDAGGSVTVNQAVGSSLVNSGEKSLVDTLGSQLMTQLPDGTVTSGSATYERAGELLGYTMALKGTAAGGTTAESDAVVDGLRGANLLEAGEEITSRAPIVLVLLGDEITGDGADTILGGLLRGLSQQARGVVVAAPTVDEQDQLTRLRDGDALASVTSVDGVETPAGQVSTVLALARAYDTQGGAFGAGGSDGSVPLG